MINVFKAWTNSNSIWCAWVKPISFICTNPEYVKYSFEDVTINTTYLTLDKNTAIIVDLPGINSINEGLSLAKIGYVPVPIYNATMPQVNAMSTVDNFSIQIGLIKGSQKLKDIRFDTDSPPAFLIDSNRMNRLKFKHSVFDNSWDIYPQDFPSSKFFIDNNINRIIIRTDTINSDLMKITRKFNKDGLDIFICNELGDIKKISKFKVAKDKGR